MSQSFFRIIRGPVPTLEDFRSAHDLGVSNTPPEGLEREWAESISVYDGLEYTIRRAETARREIGHYVVELIVPTDGSVEFAKTTRNRHHYSIYGRPDDLIRLVHGEAIPVSRG